MSSSPSKVLSLRSDNLFKPTKIGKQTIAHRVVLAPLTRFKSVEYVPTNPMQATYYAQRSSPGGLLITEATLISPAAGSYDTAPGIWNNEQKLAWKEITDAVHKKGGIIFCQLWHLGRASAKTHVYKGKSYPPLSASATKLYKKAETAKELSIDEIQGVVKEYADAAKFAMESGFDGVEIHGANGYLIDQFLQTNSNKREDRYGASLVNRLRFPLEVIDAVVAAVGQERVGIRMSPFSDIQGMKMEKPLDTFVPYVKAIVSAHKNLAWVHSVEPRVVGLGDARVPTVGETLQPLREVVNEANKANNQGNGIRFISAGGYKAEDALKDSEERPNDLFAFGRWFIANPDLPQRIQNRWPLNQYDRKTFYSKGPVGYIDQPTYREANL